MERQRVRRVYGTVYIILWFGLWLLSNSIPVYARDYRFTDAHLHYGNYALQSQGFQALFSEMGDNKIDRAVVFGLGYEISWPDARAYRVKYYMDTQTGTDYTPPVYFNKMGDYRLLMDYAKLSSGQKAVIYPFLQAINVTDRNEIYYVREMFNNHPELCGIGELMIRTGALNKVTPLTPAGDTVALAPILDFAAANRMPVLLHQNLADEASKSPEDFQDPIYVKEITDLLSRHPDTTVIWAHAGIGRNVRVRDHLNLLRRLLAAHPNLYFDLSWFVWENYIEKDLESWADLIMSYPDRFMIGSDKIGNFKARSADQPSDVRATLLSSHVGDTGVGDEMKKYIPLLRIIDRRQDGEAVSDMLAYRNINWLLSRIKNGCKSGKPVIDPWKGGDPWKDPRYARPIMTAQLKNGGPIPVSIGANYGNLADDIRSKYVCWNKAHEYSGTANSISIPESGKRQGIGLFSDAGFRGYTGFVDVSKTGPISVQSVVFIDRWDEAFGYKNTGTLFFPSGNWPVVPWWKNDDSDQGRIDKVRVPDGRRLILYPDEYFRGDVLRTISPTGGKFESLEDIADKVKSFQFVPDNKTK